MSDLAQMECVPCKGGIPPMTTEQIAPWLARLGADWQAVENHHLRKVYRFKNFRQALDFINRIGELAEQIGHHPDLELAWGRVGVSIWTHKIDGLSESDFIFAAKVEALPRP
jgi:4a-hydroxytetrahydrobiopterin dehydratase